jgi:hypothetical protein
MVLSPAAPGTVIMNWKEIAELCQRELDRMRADLPAIASFFALPEQVAATFLSHERDTNQSVEAAVRQFAAHRAWPVMSPIERTMLCFRLEFAASLASLLAEQPAPWCDKAESQHDENRIGWLMLFAWEQEGFSTLHENLSRLIPPKNET